MATVQQLMNMEGRVSVVTGGASGIGFRMALGLAEAGSNIVIASRKLEACEKAAGQLEQTGVKALALRCDVTKKAEVDAMRDDIMRHFGRVDVLINNAGPPPVLPRRSRCRSSAGSRSSISTSRVPSCALRRSAVR